MRQDSEHDMWRRCLEALRERIDGLLKGDEQDIPFAEGPGWGGCPE